MLCCAARENLRFGHHYPRINIPCCVSITVIGIHCIVHRNTKARFINNILQIMVIPWRRRRSLRIAVLRFRRYSAARRRISSLEEWGNRILGDEPALLIDRIAC